MKLTWSAPRFYGFEPQSISILALLVLLWRLLRAPLFLSHNLSFIRQLGVFEIADGCLSLR